MHRVVHDAPGTQIGFEQRDDVVLSERNGGARDADRRQTIGGEAGKADALGGGDQVRKADHARRAGRGGSEQRLFGTGAGLGEQIADGDDFGLDHDLGAQAGAGEGGRGGCESGEGEDRQMSDRFHRRHRNWLVACII